ncbi:3'(2'),5'-bisphosphate nucleotidase CysQ [Candidatus Venteria ishoeyi]|uniref:3'(2'),5'-bisphosphate nucleotidase CysQ n=1 Tax=Candidatus Venteria ishoeyi TaxID=1899563 RepID=A0A1H6FDC1_9GAMM|nr:3'(2'),5'-bisphosphate nucleotidase CysQ [Candidatus Venteria ishoeyi]SEH07319.1 3'(2')%2C5'-bisphosphate nucleotidase CysQ [Candidatus Venteria ishoeyi]
MNDKRYETLLDEVLVLAKQAAEAILEIYQREDMGIESKADDSPLTLADKAAHEILFNGLRALEDWPVLSEEDSDIDFAQRQQWQRYWLVDPLDGTKEFIKRNGEFTVNIALIENHQPVLGVVYVPVTHHCYFAATGIGAYKQVPESLPHPIHVAPYRPKQVSLAGSRSHGSEMNQQFIQCLGENTQVQSIGSSLKMCLVAEGEVDLYPRFGLTSEWDTAAAQCIVEQAGGQLTDLDLKNLRYNTKESLLNPHFIAFSSLENHWLQCLRTVMG